MLNLCKYSQENKGFNFISRKIKRKNIFFLQKINHLLLCKNKIHLVVNKTTLLPKKIAENFRK